jgi:molybdate transport system substrate-binding protein
MLRRHARGRRPAATRTGLLVALSVGALLGDTGCGFRRETAGGGFTPTPTAKAGEQGHVAVLAADVLTPVLEAANGEFSRDHAGIAVECRTLPIGELRAQVAGGQANGDLLLTTEGPLLDNLTKPGRAEADAQEHVASLNLVLAGRRGNPLKVKRLEDLRRGNVAAIALPDPKTCMAGALFEQALGKAGLQAALEPKVQRVGGEKEACEAVAEGKADLAVTYAPRVMFGDLAKSLCIAFYLPAELGAPVHIVSLPLAQPLGPPARAYAAYLLSSRGQAAFRRFGFEPAKPPSPTDAEKSLYIPCGAGLQPAMDHLADLYFERRGVRADFCYAGSGMLLAQLNFARRGDLYMPGEGFWVTLAARRGFIAKKRPVVYFVPVIGVPKGNPANVHSLQDLARPGVRVCVGDPEALAVGPVTVHILERAGLLARVRANVAMTCGCIPELANAISMKSADAGVIWDAVAWQYRDRIDSIPIPVEYNEAAEVLIATLTVSRQPEEAERFMDFVASPEAAEIFRQHGFRTRKPEGMRLAPQDGPGA